MSVHSQARECCMQRFNLSCLSPKSYRKTTEVRKSSWQYVALQLPSLQPALLEEARLGKDWLVWGHVLQSCCTAGCVEGVRVGKHTLACISRDGPACTSKRLWSSRVQRTGKQLSLHG